MHLSTRYDLVLNFEILLWDDFFFTIYHTLSQRSIHLSFMVLSQFRIKNIYLLSMYELLIWSEFSDQSILLVKGVEFSALRPCMFINS